MRLAAEAVNFERSLCACAVIWMEDSIGAVFVLQAEAFFNFFNGVDAPRFDIMFRFINFMAEFFENSIFF